MQELHDKIHELLGLTIASGDLDEMIRKKLSKTIDDILDDLLRSYSPLGKQLRQQLESGLNVNLDIGLGGYNQLVADIVSQRLDAAVQGEWKAKLQAQLDDMLRAAPASIKLSDLLVRLAEEHEYDAQANDWEHATLLVEETQHGSTWVYLDPQPRREGEKYNFQWSLMISKDGELWSARETIRGLELGRSSQTQTHRRDLFDRKTGMEKLLFQLHAGNSRVELDREPGLHEHEYDHQCEC